jgi:hypothetical protein
MIGAAVFDITCKRGWTASSVRYHAASFCEHSLPGLIRFLVLLLISATCNVAGAQKQRDTLVFGVFAYLGVEQTRAKYAPLVDYLNQTLRDERVELKVLSQADINQGLAKGELDIVTTNPTHFLVTRKRFALSGVIATLVPSEGGQALHQLGGRDCGGCPPHRHQPPGRPARKTYCHAKSAKYGRLSRPGL